LKNEECDVAAEEAILLAIFQTPAQLRTMLEKGINVMSFGVMPYRAAWEAMMKLHLQDRAIDELRLRSELGNLWPQSTDCTKAGMGRYVAIPTRLSGEPKRSPCFREVHGMVETRPHESNAVPANTRKHDFGDRPRHHRARPTTRNHLRQYDNGC